MHIMFALCVTQIYYCIIQVNIPDTVTGRCHHSLSVWSVTPTTNWIIVIGGGGVCTDTQVIELSEYMCVKCTRMHLHVLYTLFHILSELLLVQCLNTITNKLYEVLYW